MDNGVNKKNIDKFNLKEVIGLLVVVAVVSLITGFAVSNRFLKDKNKNMTNNTSLNSFIENYNYIVNNYYGELDENKLLDSALKGVLEAIGDPYTVYMDETEVNNFNIKLEGSYQGLGVEVFVNKNNNLEILTVLKNSPAESSGLKSGDIITKLNGESVSDSQNFAQKIKGKKQIKLTIKRDDEVFEVELTKGTIILDSVFHKVFERNGNNIGYLGISIFANNTDEQVKVALEALEESKIDSLIIDVRGNTGGHLTSVENILSLFLDSSHIIYKIEDDKGIQTIYSKGKKTKEYPIVILTNEASASASEILTATLKEEYGAKSVGTRTYGKGTAQELKTLPDGTQYKITTKRWLTPKGNSIADSGISADFNIEFDVSYYNEPIDENDNQLQKAISVILGL
ncbi:MAG: S41 family peptidase [Firmicutes bacterium]|nr:S41 family peptidase [Bacillota bacterium]